MQVAGSGPGLATGFAGQRGRLFLLSLGTSLLTLVTVGLYRFWMKTRVRRYLWSSIQPGGLPLEYVGDPLEKLLGFLTAVVLMAFYIGIVNLVLMFASYSLFHQNFWAYGVSFLGLLPILFFAQYRARRYILARTRWRGIRFGAEPGAWGYAWRALLWWMVAILSLTALWPRMAFALEKYRIDRTWYGTARMRQEGSPWMLMGAFRHIWIGAAMCGIGGILLALGINPTYVGPLAMVQLIGPFWILYGMAHWKADSLRRLATGKRLGPVRVSVTPRPWRIFRIYLFGYFLTGLCLLALSLPFIVIFALWAPDSGSLLGESAADTIGLLPAWLLWLAGAATYFLVFIFWGVLRQVFVIFPVLRHVAETTVILSPAALATVTQRERDAFVEAEGFADALDVGAAF